jgi:hypothetical protein
MQRGAGLVDGGIEALHQADEADAVKVGELGLDVALAVGSSLLWPCAKKKARRDAWLLDRWAEVNHTRA